MSLEIDDYVFCIEGMLIKYYEFFWNCRNGLEVNFFFGNSKSNNNMWYKYYIDEDKKIREIIDGVKFVKFIGLRVRVFLCIYDIVI